AELRELDVVIRGSLEERASAAFVKYLRKGEHMDPQEFRTLQEYRATLGSENGGAAYPGSTAGFFTPVSFQHSVTAASKFAGPMLTNATVVDTPKGAPMPFPQDDDTTVSGEAVSENSQTTAQDVTVKETVLGAYKYSSKIVKVSNEALEDTAFDVTDYLSGKFGIRLG